MIDDKKVEIPNENPVDIQSLGELTNGTASDEFIVLQPTTNDGENLDEFENNAIKVKRLRFYLNGKQEKKD